MSTIDTGPHTLAYTGDIVRHAVTDMICGGSTEECTILVMCRGKRLHIDIHPDNLQHHKAEYARLIDGLKKSNDDADCDLEWVDPEEELYDWALRPFLSLLPKLMPEQPTTPQKATVTECFDPPTFFFALESICGILTAIPKAEEPEASHFWIPRMKIKQSLIRPELLIVRPQDLEVVWDPQLQEGPDAGRVSLGVSDYYFLKPTNHDSVREITREVETLLRLQDLGVTGKIRAPKLHGYVQYEEEDRISGLLLTYIDARGTLATMVHFQDPLEEEKKKWMDQIEVMLEAIHQAGLVWGDAKADNILIDKEDNAWIIDFGGSYTQGWVDKDKAETVEGDLQGLLAIKRYLGFCSSEEPRPREGGEVICDETISSCKEVDALCDGVISS